MSKVKKECQFCGKSFEAEVKEVNRGNAKYCSQSCASKVPKALKYTQVCKHCGKEFNTASKNAKYCSDSCKQKNYRAKQRSLAENGSSIKTYYKWFKDIPCEICKWDITTRDIHHIKAVSEGGTNEIENLISVCPNCHRMIHNNFISENDLLKIIENRTISSSCNKQELDAKSGN